MSEDADVEYIQASLNEEQKALLMALEEEFKNRYTEEDENFKAALQRKLPPPPIFENWVRNYDERPSKHDNVRDYRHYNKRHRSHNDYESYRGYRREDDDDYNYNRRGNFYHPSARR